jgi:hypothetical protein
MAGITRVNGLGHAHDVLYSTMQLKAFVIDAGASLATQGGIGGAVEALAREVAPLMMKSVGTDGLVHVVVDGHHVTAPGLQARVRNLGTVNSYDFSGATVTLGTDIVVSA